jgi:hypothetical protein
MSRPKKTTEYQRFDDAMTQLLKVPHSEIKAKLEAEKAAKAARKKTKRVSKGSSDAKT